MALCPRMKTAGTALGFRLTRREGHQMPAWVLLPADSWPREGVRVYHYNVCYTPLFKVSHIETKTGANLSSKSMNGVSNRHERAGFILRLMDLCEHFSGKL